MSFFIPDELQGIREKTALGQRIDEVAALRLLECGDLNALGQLGDPRAVAVLEKLTGASEDNPARKAAEQAIEKLRAARKPADDYKNLRKEVTSLKQSNSKLTKELGDLKKRFDAALGDKNASKKEITEKK